MEEKEALDVTDFGATGDGVTDDREAIQRAIDEAVRMGKGIELPDGLYRVGPWPESSTITIEHVTVESVNIGPIRITG